MKTFGYAQKKSSLKGSISSKNCRESDILFNVWMAAEDTSCVLIFFLMSGWSLKTRAVSS